MPTVNVIILLRAGQYEADTYLVYVRDIFFQLPTTTTMRVYDQRDTLLNQILSARVTKDDGIDLLVHRRKRTVRVCGHCEH